MRYPEFLQFRAAPGSAMTVQQLAEAEGKSPGEVLREALELRLASAKRATHMPEPGVR